LAIAWNEDDPRDAVALVQNLTRLLRLIADQAHLRQLPTVSMAQEWHRRIYAGIKLPVPYYAGGIRDSDTKLPELYGYEVRIGAQSGVESRYVPAELEGFEVAMQEAVAKLDAAIPASERPDNAGKLQSVLTLCSYAHGEWVRIHPFANGNGRTARIWANWSALRYGLPPFVRLKPRPEGYFYAKASAISMRGEHQTMVAVFADMLAGSLRASEHSPSTG
jgi:Fic family protein